MRASLSLLLLLSACAEPQSEPGNVSVALVTTGSDGATYRLPAGSRLQLSNTTFFDEYSLDGATTSVSLETPIGTYDAQLLDAAGDIPAVWALEKIAGDGSVTTVPATLLTAMPASVTVTESTPADLVLSFRTAGGTITFTHGTLDVSLDVSSVGATSSASSWDAALTASTVTTSPSVPPALVASLPAAGASGLGIRIHGLQSGAWAQAASKDVCVDVAIDEGRGTGNGAFADLVTEASAGSGSLCLFTFEGQQYVDIFLFRVGAPTTPTFAGLAPSLLFMTEINLVLPGPAFDGTTLDLDALSGSHTLPGTANVRVRPSPALAGTPNWYRAILSGTVTFDFQPLP